MIVCKNCGDPIFPLNDSEYKWIHAIRVASESTVHFIRCQRQTGYVKTLYGPIAEAES